MTKRLSELTERERGILVAQLGVARQIIGNIYDSRCIYEAGTEGSIALNGIVHKLSWIIGEVGGGENE